jgi:hypothetical protein
MVLWSKSIGGIVPFQHKHVLDAYRDTEEFMAFLIQDIPILLD